MAVLILDFSLKTDLFQSEASTRGLIDKIEESARALFPTLKVVSNLNLEGSWIRILTAGASLVTVRIFPNGLANLAIDYYSQDSETPAASIEIIREIEASIKSKVEGIKWTRILPNLKTDKAIRYYLTSDSRLIEYDVTALLFEEVTPYQKVQIVRSKTMGNILVLDDLQNLGELDLPYTHTLMRKGIEHYEGKEVLILGGGDGALLYELLQEKPKEVVMVELDEVVIKACAKYLRSVCGDVLDKYEGPNYKIIIGDCLTSLDKYEREGRRFDYIFGDLTDVPISVDESLELWAFIKQVLEMSFRVLKPDGKFMTHISGEGCTEALEAYKEQLRRIRPEVKYQTTTNYVPSFYETWLFCQVSLKNEEAEKKETE